MARKNKYLQYEQTSEKLAELLSIARIVEARPGHMSNERKMQLLRDIQQLTKTLRRIKLKIEQIEQHKTKGASNTCKHQATRHQENVHHVSN